MKIKFNNNKKLLKQKITLKQLISNKNKNPKLNNNSNSKKYNCKTYNKNKQKINNLTNNKKRNLRNQKSNYSNKQKINNKINNRKKNLKSQMYSKKKKKNSFIYKILMKIKMSGFVIFVKLTMLQLIISLMYHKRMMLYIS